MSEYYVRSDKEIEKTLRKCAGAGTGRTDTSGQSPAAQFPHPGCPRAAGKGAAGYLPLPCCGAGLNSYPMDKITSLMENISQYDYDVSALKDTLDNLDGDSGGFFSRIWKKVTSIFKSDSSDGGIINNTQDDVLGSGAVTDSTLDSSGSGNPASDDDTGFLKRIISFFQGLFDREGDSGNQETSGTDTSASDADLPSDTQTDTDNGIMEYSTADPAGEESTADEEDVSDSGMSDTETEEDTYSGNTDTSGEGSGTEEDTGSMMQEEEETTSETGQ